MSNMADSARPPASSAPAPPVSAFHNFHNFHTRSDAAISRIQAPVKKEQRISRLKEKGMHNVHLWLSDTEYFALMEYAQELSAGTAARIALKKFLANEKRKKGKL